jgi:hypothetical protein
LGWFKHGLNNYMATTPSKVQDCFEGFDSYALGDLKLFHELSSKAETEEATYADSLAGATYHITSSTSRSTTFETTESPPVGGYPYASPVIHKFSRATIPFALTMFSCMEFLGFLYTGINSGGGYTKRNIEEFLEHTTNKPTSDEITCLIELFRHGLAHNYFPKLGNAISYHSKNQQSLFFRINGSYCLNVNHLESLFLDGYDRIKRDIANYPRFDRNLEKMESDYSDNKKCMLF